MSIGHVGDRPSGGPGASGEPEADPALWVADPSLAGLWLKVSRLAGQGPGEMGLAAGERPAADVQVLGRMLASVEFSTARFMHAASSAGCLPLTGPAALLTASGWSGPWARRLARCGALVAEHASLARAWADGRITSDHVDPIARHAERFSVDELAALIGELEPLWARISPAGVERFVKAADRMLHPPDGPPRDEVDAYAARNVSFSVTRDMVLVSAELPRVEGEAIMAAIEAVAERLRSTAEHTRAGARRADALVELVNRAAAADALPSRGGLPVALTVTVEHTSLGDPVLVTSRGHLLSESETRWACCDAQVTPVLVERPGCAAGRPAEAELDRIASVECESTEAGQAADRAMGAGIVQVGDGVRGADVPSSDAVPDVPRGDAEPQRGPTARIAALATLLFDSRTPLAVGRTARTATPAQRRALAIRDRGCLIPGCPIPAEACQAHHLTDWAQGGKTDIENLVLLCWAHHRQVDLHMWTITPNSAEAASPAGNRPARMRREASWPANNGAPFTINRAPRTRWRT